MKEGNFNEVSILLTTIVSKGYRSKARGYVIYSPRALPKGAARGQRTRGINHITTSSRPINGLFLLWRGFLKGCKKCLYSVCLLFIILLFFCFLTLHAGTGGIHKFLGFLIMLVFQSRISNYLFAVNPRNSLKSQK